MPSINRLFHGVWTVARRRGPRYLWYLISGVASPRLAYRFLWGPSAPRWLASAFARSQVLASRRATAEMLRRAGVLASSGAAGQNGPRITAGDAEALLDRTHASGIAGVQAGFGTLVPATSGAAFAGVPAGARFYPRRGVHFHAARDADRRAFNQAVGATLLTEQEARRSLAERKANVPHGYRDYAPIDFGGGLTIGQIASTDSGTGRWDFFNRHVVAPLVAGKRVIDLGCNNGSLPLMMLRAGAADIVAIEYTPAIAEFARLNAGILAWRDIRRYRMQVITGDMRLFLDDRLGSFDVVTAFCSLYYLPPDDMACVVIKAASMGATLVLQSNDAIHNLPATTRDLRALMTANGYPDITVYAPRGFARPLLVGTPSAAARAGTIPRALVSSGANEC